MSVVLPPIPASLLGSTMSVRRPVDSKRGGEHGEPFEVGNVRFEPSYAAGVSGYVFADPNAVGRVWVDAENSDGAVMEDGSFCAPVGSLASIDGGEWATVSQVAPIPGFFGKVHHWELVLS